jgi:hypothetical protein
MNRHQTAPIQPGHAPGWQSSMESVSAESQQDGPWSERSERITRWIFSIVAVIMTTWVWAGLSLRELLALLPH